VGETGIRGSEVGAGDWHGGIRRGRVGARRQILCLWLLRAGALILDSQRPGRVLDICTTPK
jgi:hypothetical protein